MDTDRDRAHTIWYFVPVRRQKLIFSMLYHVEQFLLVPSRTSEGRESTEEDVEYNTCRPHVHFQTITLKRNISKQLYTFALHIKTISIWINADLTMLKSEEKNIFAMSVFHYYFFKSTYEHEPWLLQVKEVSLL